MSYTGHNGTVATREVEIPSCDAVPAGEVVREVSGQRSSASAAG